MEIVRSFARALEQRRVALALAALLLLITAMGAATYQAFHSEQFSGDRQKTIVLGPTQFAPQNPAALRVVVRDLDDQPVANADIVVSVKPKNGGATQTVYSGKTDSRGTAPVQFTLPPDTPRDETLVVETQSNVGHDTVTQPIVVQRTYKLLATTDKPLYQPGQTIHLRALALAVIDRVPAAGQKLEFLIEDPKGNKVFRQSVSTSAYGIASADFAIADTVISGDYKITASLGDTKSEKTVGVRPYVLPKFKLSVETERPFYSPGEHVTGRVRSDYFFGKPVNQADVTLTGIVNDVQQTKVVNLTGKTDGEGVYSFAFDLPKYFASSGLDKNRTSFGIQVSVTDQANHTEQTALTLPVAQDAIVIDAVPESGKLVPGVENILYVLTTLPDGSPVEADVQISAQGQNLTAHTGKYGIGQVSFTPQRGTAGLDIAAHDAKGSYTRKFVNLQTDSATNQILLRTDRATYRVGDTMQLDVLSSGSTGTVYVDLIKEGQTISTRSINTVKGHATDKIDVTAEMTGAVEVHAYHIERDGTITRDTRLVVVEQANELNITVKADHDTYRPGDTSHVSFNVTDAQGKGVPSALGITAVDESVFALAEQDAGFAKLYFLLTNQLLDPKFELEGFSLEDVVSYNGKTQSPDVSTAQDQSARAAWANVAPVNYPMKDDTEPQKRAALAHVDDQRFNDLGDKFTWVLSLLPFVFIGFVIASLRARGLWEKAFEWWLGAMVIYFMTSPVVVGSILIFGWVAINSHAGGLVIVLTISAWAIAFAVLTAHALTKQDRRLQVALALFATYLVLLGSLLFLQNQINLSGERVTYIVSTYLVALATLLLIGAWLFVSQEKQAGVCAVLMAVLLIPTTILLGQMPNAGVILRSMGNPNLYSPVTLLTGCAPAPTPAPPPGDYARVPPATSAPAPTAAPAAQALTSNAAAPKANEATAAPEPPRLRQYFPETLYVNPQVITDENGSASVDIPLADSITTWRLAAMASSQRGDLGSTSAGMRVFQDFFVDIDLPVALTQNDEISIPVAVYNYLPQAQKVRLQIDSQPWFALQDDAEKTLSIASNDIDVVYFRIKAQQFGTQRLKVTAYGEKLSDAIQREVRVYPDGKPFETTQSNWLKGNMDQVVNLPPAAIPGATRVQVQIYPSIMSQTLGGLDGLLRTPNGCFEQTSSTTFPNVLILNYLKQTKQVSPEIQMKAENYIALGYQRLLTFEVDGGGFSIFGHSPASAMLSAKGIMEFGDMSKVYPVDPAIITRTRNWLLSRQKADGTWDGTAGWDHPPEGASGDPLPLTAIVTWALAESGTRDNAGVGRAINYLRQNASRASDPYVMALIANALVAYDPNDATTRDVLARLDGAKSVNGDTIYWTNKMSSFSGAYGESGSLETTALATYAFLRSHTFTNSAQQGLNYLIQKKSASGAWSTTQATILALRALSESSTAIGEPTQDATVQISFNGAQSQPIKITRDNANVVQAVTFDDVNPGKNSLSFKVDGKGSLAYQVSTQYYLPWNAVPPTPEKDNPVAIQVSYDRTTLSVDDLVGVTARIRMTKPVSARMTLVDLGLPPGFTVMSEDLDAAVAAKTISRYELTGRQIILYLEEFNPSKPVVIQYHLKAKFPLRAKTPSSETYDYYNPSMVSTQAPLQLTVK